MPNEPATPTLGRRMRTATAANLAAAAAIYAGAWLGTSVLLPALIHHGWLPQPVIYLRDAAR